MSVWLSLLQRLGVRVVAPCMNLYPPYLGAGVRVRSEGEAIVASMKLRSWNQNLFGTHFGGSIYSMCDPFFVVIVAAKLGPEFMVWDKAAQVQFRRPGKGRLEARFEVSDGEIEELRKRVDLERKVEPMFRTSVTDETGAIVAQVEKTLYVRKKLRDVDPARRL